VIFYCRTFVANLYKDKVTFVLFYLIKFALYSYLRLTSAALQQLDNFNALTKLVNRQTQQRTMGKKSVFLASLPIFKIETWNFVHILKK